MDVDFMRLDEWNLRSSHKLIGNCERNFSAWVDHSIKNIFLHEATKHAKNKCLRIYLKKQ